MISHTVRVFKLMYIVAGILISNEEICETVDRIQIAPRVEMKPEQGQRGQRLMLEEKKQKQQRSSTTNTDDSVQEKRRRRKVSVTSLAGGMVRGVTSTVTSRMSHRLSWLPNFSLIISQWRALALSFTVWTIPNLLMEYTSSYISKKFFINSDCDMIYK